MTVHREPAQTFDDFRRSQPNRPDARRHVIYLQPLGDFRTSQSPSLEMLRAYAADFFQMEVKALAPISMSASGVTSRTNSMTGWRQLPPS
ncbi:MAG: hypothetical protein ACLQU3_26935 [Limisphaerales bacterium]